MKIDKTCLILCTIKFYKTWKTDKNIIILKNSILSCNYQFRDWRNCKIVWNPESWNFKPSYLMFLEIFYWICWAAHNSLEPCFLSLLFINYFIFLYSTFVDKNINNFICRLWYNERDLNYYGFSSRSQHYFYY